MPERPRGPASRLPFASPLAPRGASDVPSHSRAADRETSRNRAFRSRETRSSYTTSRHAGHDSRSALSLLSPTRAPTSLVAAARRPAGGRTLSERKKLPLVYLARHGETAWTVSGQHTGHTDIPLTANGEAQAERLGERLRGLTFASVLVSPLQRARRTCELAGFGSLAEIEPDLIEWNYGDYEGRRTVDIHA